MSEINVPDLNNDSSRVDLGVPGDARFYWRKFVLHRRSDHRPVAHIYPTGFTVCCGDQMLTGLPLEIARKTALDLANATMRGRRR